MVLLRVNGCSSPTWRFVIQPLILLSVCFCYRLTSLSMFFNEFQCWVGATVKLCYDFPIFFHCDSKWYSQDFSGNFIQRVLLIHTISYVKLRWFGPKSEDTLCAYLMCVLFKTRYFLSKCHIWNWNMYIANMYLSLF